MFNLFNTQIKFRTLFFVGAVLCSTQVNAGEIEDLKTQVQMLMSRVEVLETRLLDKSTTPEAPKPQNTAVPVPLNAPALIEPVVQEAKAEVPKEESIVKARDDKLSLTVYGAINRAVLFADNGFNSKFFHVDNDNIS